ncbi:MAG: hypothetical protein JWR71_1412 [Pseudarthrobacter sp.]|nr:hypothetical protein [Pseudarthrobacter sp.]
MVIFRSEPSRSMTSIHGGLRRGAATAALGAVLVFSAGIPASQAAEGRSDPGRPAHAKGPKDGTVIDGVLKGLLGGSAGRPKPSEDAPSPVPTSPATRPSPARTAQPTPPETATPTPAPAAPTSAAPTSAPARAVPAPSAPGTGAPATPGQETAAPAAGTSTAAPAAPDAGTGRAPGDGTGSEETEGDGTESDRTESDGGPAAPGTEKQAGGEGTRLSGSSQDPAATADETSAAPGSDQAAGQPTAAGAPAARHKMIPAPEPATETAKVWLGVGLVGSAGAAGLLFTRIRNF